LALALSACSAEYKAEVQTRAKQQEDATLLDDWTIGRIHVVVDEKRRNVCYVWMTDARGGISCVALPPVKAEAP
jgi:hypothetical protein